MELRRLTYFLRIAEEGSLNAASRSLGIAQPALSRQMQLLEADLGVQLFKRVARGMQLTEEGDYLRSGLIHPLEQIDTVLANARAFSTHVEAHAKIGLPPGIAVLVGPHLVSRLAAEMPNLKLSIVEEDSTTLASELLHGRIDIALLSGSTPDERLFHSEIAREELVLVGSPASRLAGRLEVAFSDLEGYPIVAPAASASLTLMLEKLAVRRACKIKIAFDVSSPAITKSLVMAGSAFAVLTPLSVKREIESGQLVSARIVDPTVFQLTHVSVQPHWRIARSTYKQFHGIFYSVLRQTVDSGDWPATWLLDLASVENAMT